METQQQIEQNPMSQNLPPELEEMYGLFSERIMRAGPLSIKIGKGGLSYYKDGVFVCHFNAKPQSKREDIGFADFRFASLQKLLDLESTMKAIQSSIGPEIEMKVNERWCSFHFLLKDSPKVADLFVVHIISQI